MSCHLTQANLYYDIIQLYVDTVLFENKTRKPDNIEKQLFKQMTDKRELQCVNKTSTQLTNWFLSSRASRMNRCTSKSAVRSRNKM